MSTVPVPEPGGPWVPPDTFASRLMLVRRSLGLTQVEAAKACGLDDGSWSNWERGVQPRGMDSVVRQICSTFGVDRDWLMWGTTAARMLRNPDQLHLQLAWSQPQTDRRFRSNSGNPLLALVPDLPTLRD